MSHSFCSLLQSHVNEYGMRLCIILTSAGAISWYAHSLESAFFKSCKFSMSKLHSSIDCFTSNKSVAIDFKSFYAFGLGSTDIIATTLLAAQDTA